MYLGAHMSTSGGLHKAFEHIKAVRGTALQIFTANQRQWKTRTLTETDIDLFRTAWKDWGPYPVASHASYLINPASDDEAKSEKSVNSLVQELKRCEQLGITMLVMHPGSHMGLGEKTGLELFTRRMDQALEWAKTPSVKILLETTAGQGTNLGRTFEQLAKIISLSKHPGSLAVCYDTCHAFAAGYDIRTPQSYAKTMDEFQKTLGLDRLLLFHLNDSKTELGSRRDRHEHIGKGEIGLAGFKAIINDTRFAEVPKILETPKGKDLEMDRVNMAALLS